MSDGENINLPQEASTEEVYPDSIETTEFSAFLGPLPPPSILAQYKNLGILDKILKLAMDENDRQNRLVAIQEKECQMQQDVIDAQIKTKNIATITSNVAYVCVVIFVLLFCAGLFGVAIWFAIRYMFVPASVVLLITVGLPKLIKVIYSTKKK